VLSLAGLLLREWGGLPRAGHAVGLMAFPAFLLASSSFTQMKRYSRAVQVGVLGSAVAVVAGLPGDAKLVVRL
jgi:hypothetical protein